MEVQTKLITKRFGEKVALITEENSTIALATSPEYRDRELITTSKATKEKNKELVLEAFDTLFNQRDYIAAERYWSSKYIQHSAHIQPGREGLFNLIKSIPPMLKYESGTIVADGDFVIVHGRFFGRWPACELDRSRHRLYRRWNSSRALGCDSRRSHPGAVKERPSHVWEVSEYLRGEEYEISSGH